MKARGLFDWASYVAIGVACGWLVGKVYAAALTIIEVRCR